MKLKFHKHKCPRCGTVWRHSQIRRKSKPHHKCPQCGKVVWVKWTPTKRPRRRV